MGPIHGLDVRHREAQMTGPPTLTAVPEAHVDDFGESLLSSLERQQVGYHTIHPS